MDKNTHKIAILRFVAGLTVALLFGVLLLPIVAGALGTDCDTCDDCDECKDCEKSVCACVVCPPVTLAHEVHIVEHDHTLNVRSYDILDPSDNFNCDFFARLDRPPRYSSATQS